jgi:3-hydroxyisobutyrate dehydrogenase
MEDKPRIALLGLGLMGTGMASRLLGQGYPVTVYNRSPEKTQPLAKLGASVATTAKQAVLQADIVISMLADDHAARSVWLGEDGALAGAPGGAVLIECSTATVAWVKELAAAAGAANRNLKFLDAPVTGSKPHAAAGELTFLVGGAAEDLKTVTPVLSAMGKQIVHLGPVGSGALMKLINNFVCGVQVVALGEAIAAIERSTLNREQAVGVLTGGAPGSPIVKMVAARMLASTFEPNFPLKLITKDLTYAQQQAGHTEVGAAALKTFQRAIDAGLGDLDFSAVIKLLRDAGIKK